jgi:hypothetical protein
MARSSIALLVVGIVLISIAGVPWQVIGQVQIPGQVQFTGSVKKVQVTAPVRVTSLVPCNGKYFFTKPSRDELEERGLVAAGSGLRRTQRRCAPARLDAR